MKPSSTSITRRAALAATGAGAVGIGLALVTPAATQEATPELMASHPVVGAWILATVRATPNTQGDRVGLGASRGGLVERGGTFTRDGHGYTI
jgi:hypothetical protein